ncbi:MAG: N-6 DNA methylase [Spirochaetes bacterium]|nr:N-6 DNA methylase [Spirochaetota bacterium]
MTDRTEPQLPASAAVLRRITKKYPDSFFRIARIVLHSLWRRTGIVDTGSSAAVSFETIIVTRYGFDPAHFHAVINLYQDEPPLPSSISDELSASIIAHGIDTDTVTAAFETALAADTPDGTHYTPPEVVTFMFERLRIHNASEQIIYDPAMGCGVFLLEAARRGLSGFTDSTHDTAERYRTVVESLHGVEIDSRAHQTALVNLLITLAPAARHLMERNITPPKLRLNLVCADALTRTDAGFADIVIMNPPYIGEKGHKALFDRTMREAPRWRKHYQGKMDYAYWFIIRGVESLKHGGMLCAITSSYWQTAYAASTLRQYLLNHVRIREITSLGNMPFRFAKGVHTAVSVCEHCSDAAARAEHRPFIIRLDSHTGAAMQSIASAAGLPPGKTASGVSISSYTAAETQSMLGGGPWHFTNPEKRTAGFSASTHIPLGAICDINQGMVPNPQRTARAHVAAGLCEKAGEPIFAFTEEQYRTFIETCTPDEREHFVALHKNSDIAAFTLKKPRRYVLYVTPDTDIASAPRLHNHLSRYKEILIHRRECRTGRIPWYSLHWPRTRMLFTEPAIVCPYHAKTPVFAVAEHGCYAATDVYFITLKKENTVERLACLAALLNAANTRNWFAEHGSRKGAMMLCVTNTLKDIPIPRDYIDNLDRFTAVTEAALSCIRGNTDCSAVEKLLPKDLF